MKIPFLLLAPLLMVCGCQSKNAQIVVHPTPTKPGVVFDLPALLDKDLTLAITQLGKPVSTDVVNVPDNVAMSANWKTSNGSTLRVSYDMEGKKMFVIIFTMADKANATLNKGKLLRAGNLSLNDPRYSLKFYVAGLDRSTVGVILRPTYDN